MILPGAPLACLCVVLGNITFWEMINVKSSHLFGTTPLGGRQWREPNMWDIFTLLFAIICVSSLVVAAGSPFSVYCSITMYTYTTNNYFILPSLTTLSLSAGDFMQIFQASGQSRDYSYPVGRFMAECTWHGKYCTTMLWASYLFFSPVLALICFIVVLFLSCLTQI